MLAGSERTTVLLTGESGTGKGWVAHLVHNLSPRKAGPFVDVNCAGLSATFLESELFGHEKGAFTDAKERKQGLFELADGGTIFLDEIGDLAIELQPKLLKVIEEQRFRRVGDVEDRTVDVRLVAATSLDLGMLVRDGKFRSDLYFRVSTLVLSVPPLRERPADLPALAQRLLDAIGSRRGRRGVTLGPDALAALQHYPWPGNIRELRNVLERAVLLSDRTELRSEDLHFDPAGLATPPTGEIGGPAAAPTTLAELERAAIVRALEGTGGKVAEAAERLGIPRSTLYQKLKSLGITSSRS